MQSRIKIPDVRRDTRIGSVFNQLFYVINSTESVCPYDEVIWDFSDSVFFHPFFICGLSLYKKQCGKAIAIEGLNRYTKSYLDIISFSEPTCVNEATEVNGLMERYEKKSYIPICKFKTSENTIDSITSGLQKIIQRQCRISKRLISPLSYLIGELVANIHDHSLCEHGYIFSQYLHRDRCINICIADYGITIYGSFAKNRLIKDFINEGDALAAALGHASTKNLPNAENRGYGLPTTKGMLVNGMGGEFFLLSGGAFHRHDQQGQATVTLPKTINWDGTIVLLKIPIDVSDKFDYLKYVERI